MYNDCVMKGFKLLPFLLLLLCLCQTVQGHNDDLPDIDRRRDKPVRPPAASLDPAAAARLSARIPGLVIDQDEILGGPKWMMSPRSPLSGPMGEGRGVSSKSAGLWQPDDPDRPAKAFLSEHRDLFGLGPEALQGAVKRRAYVTDHSGLRTTVWQQQFDGIPVHEACFVATVSRHGELVSVSSRFAPDLARAAEAGRPRQGKLARNLPGLTARQAVLRAAAAVEETVSDAEIELLKSDDQLADRPHEFKAGSCPGTALASLTWLPFSAAEMRLCWSVEITRRFRGETFRVLIDAHTGELQIRRKLTFDSGEAAYHIFAGESPTPMSPGWPTPQTNQPPEVQRQWVTLSALFTNASPSGWIAEGDNETRGNNVEAHLDRDGDNVPDLPRPQGSPARVFDFPMDLSLGPETYREAAVAQLFYWCNWMHDQLYTLGFTEAAGNFQKDNFGRGGLGGDPVLADAQDGSGVNNANFTTTSDGRPPRIQMFIFNNPVPARDGDMDASVILHEYTHGLTDRLIGGGAGITQLQTYGMAEGWSDFYSLAFLTNPSDARDSVYPVGGYASHMFNGNRENYYFGIRRYPMTTDLAKNPLTFKDIDPAQASYHVGVPRNPATTSSGSQVHAMGEVWCAALWEVRANLIEKHGPTNGNLLALRLVTDALKLSPPNPSFVQARNAILLADVVVNNGINRNQIWAGFAKRGLGYSASAPDSYLVAGLKEAFDLPDNLVVSPTNLFLSVGDAGGPFIPSSQTCAVVNSGPAAIYWTVQYAPVWVTVSPAGGSLAPGATNVVTLSINTLANSLVPGAYPGSVVFGNQASGQTLSIPIQLQVTENHNGAADFLTEIFDGNGDFDLHATSLTFTPTGGSEAPSYSVCVSPAPALPTDPAGGAILPAADDYYALISLTGGAEVSLFGTRTNQVLVGSNGDLVLTVPTNLGYTLDPSRDIYTNFFYPQDSIYFSQPRLSPLYVDLHPGAGGSISWRQLSNRLAVTWTQVPEYGVANSNTFQVEWFFDGTIRFTYAGVASRVGANYTTPKVGLVRQGGLPSGFVETDFSRAHSCLPRFALLLPEDVTEGGGPWSGLVLLGAPADHGLEIQLTSSDPHVIIDPSAIYIPPGQVSGGFDVFVENDYRLMGTRPVLVTAAATGYAILHETLLVADAQTAALSVSIPPQGQEGQGLVAGRVSMDQVPEAAITVRLSSTMPALVQVPATVTIPAGANAAAFDLYLGEDSMLTGPVAVGVLAHVANWQDDADAIIVQDNEPRTLTVTIPAQVPESGGFLGNAGRILVGGYLVTNLAVTLHASDTNTLLLPERLLIEAGQNSAVFDLEVVDDELINGPRTIAVQASAAGLSNGLASIRVLDDESPSYPTNPSPAHLAARLDTDVKLGWEVQGMEVFTNVVFDVYLGTNPVPGQAEFLGRTATNTWRAPALELGTRYYWQVVASVAEVHVAGPVWQFTTVDLARFEISPAPSPQTLARPFPVTVMAFDENGNPAVDFDGPVTLEAMAYAPTASSIVIAEVDTGAADRVEFVNVSDKEISIEGWSIAVYDWTSWPAPKMVFTIPEGSIAAPGDLFQVRRIQNRPSPGAYPNFNLPEALSWSVNPTENPVAVLLRDHTGQVVDFACAVDADPAQIREPVAVPAAQWNGLPIPANTVLARTYQRIGFSDHNTSADWLVATNSVGRTNAGMSVPFYDLRPLASSPLQLSGFSGGAWSGDVTVFAPATNVFLRAQDPRGRAGLGNSFAVGVTDNLSLSLTVSPGRKTVWNPFRYTLAVSNAGPGLARGVVLVDNLPEGFEVVAANTSQGILTNLPRALVCSIGTLPALASATVEIQVMARVAGLATNRASISRAEADPYDDDNTAVAVTPVSYPLLVANDAGGPEGRTGATNLAFAVQLQTPSAQPVSVEYSTSDGTATEGQDYIGARGVLVFAPGVTNLLVPIAVLGDSLAESNETFWLNLFSPTNALVAASPAMGTVTNDDFNPSISISNAVVVEGDTGTTNAAFLVRLSAASGLPVSVSWNTTNDTAIEGLDYLPGNGRLVFPPGETNVWVNVAVLGNALLQSNRAFYLNLGYPFNGSLERMRAVGTILDDDDWRIHHFAWSPISPTQYVHEPFQATLVAQNARNELVTDYDGVVTLRAGHSNRVAVAGVGNETWAVPLGAYFHDARVQTIYSAGALGGAGRITALALDVAARPGQILSNLTLRLRHTLLGSYSTPFWETNWTVVYQSAQTFAVTGWTTLQFQAPFDYNGVENLMVDLSFNNSSYSLDGLCRASSSALPVALYYRTDSGFGDPLVWAGNLGPVALLSTQFPNARFQVELSAAMPPVAISNFVNGVWTGALQFNAPGESASLRAVDAAGRAGLSAPFEVLWRDSDFDGMPDEWEVALKLDPLNPADAAQDPDGDGLDNLKEYGAGTDPHDAASTVRILRVRVLDSNYMSLAFPSVAGRRYQVQASTDIAGESWASASVIYAGVGGQMEITNRYSRIEPARFYRVRVLP